MGNKMTLADLSTNQLDRMYRRVYQSLGDGGMFGWDWPTLRMCYPAKYEALRAILCELRKRSLPAID